MTRDAEPTRRHSSSKPGIAPRRGLGLLLAVLGLLIAVGASTAFAEDTDAPGEDAASFVPGWTSEAAHAEAAQHSGPEILALPTDPGAAEALPHDDLGRGEASDLLTAVFGEVLDEAAGIFDELEVDQFHSDYVAVVGAEEPDAHSGEEAGEPGLLTSLLPLRAENSEGQKAPIDLDLQHVEGGLRPENPLVEVDIPAEIDQGISLPEAGVTIDLADAPDNRTASTLEGGAAFYPNVAPDSDLVVLPTPTGFETSTVLRTPDAPLTQTFELSIPPGAHLELSNEHGASVLKGGEPLVAIRPPTAIDAEGNSVPVTLEVDGNSVVIRTSPAEWSAYPILVDPIYETYFWNMYPGAESPEWIPKSSPCFIAAWRMWMSEGMTMYSCSSVVNTPGSQATWNYYVPRFFSDMADPLVHERPTSYIKKMTTAALTFSFWEGNPVRADPHITLGIWSEAYGRWVSAASQNGMEGPVTNKSVEFNNIAEVTDAKNAGIALTSYETSLGFQRNVIVGQATVEISDKDYPRVAEKANPAQWVNNSPTSPIYFKAIDKGLGMHSMVISQKNKNGAIQAFTTRNKNCDGSARVPCPRSWSSTGGPTLNYDPSLMPQGENWVVMDAIDPLGRSSALDPEVPIRSEVKVRVDHSAPALGLSGTLTEQAKVGTTAAQYSLNYFAGDGDHEPATALAPVGSAGTGVGQLEVPMGIAVDSESNIFAADRKNSRVLKFNSSGSFLIQIGSYGSGKGMLKEPSDVAIDSQKYVWVVDTGNHRLVRFNDEGEFVAMYGRSVNKTQTDAAAPEAARNVCTALSGNTCQTGVAGSSNGQFYQPRGIALTAGGNLLVADTSNHRVQKLSPSGAYLAKIGSFGTGPAQLNQPYDVAVAPDGAIWVADTFNHRIQKWTDTFEHLFQVGSNGAANGQFNTPAGIAIAPSGNAVVTEAKGQRVQVFQSNGTYLRKFGAAGVGNAQFNEPHGLAIDSSGTAVLADASNRRITRWAHADLNPQSGVTKVEVKVDNQAPSVFYDKPCAERDCSAAGQLLFNSGFYSTGQHKVVVTATDGVKLTSSKELIVNTVKDATKPALAATSPFFTAPEGWVEQKSYPYVATAKDPGGYGVTSLELKIDGKAVSSSSQACPNGGCERTLSGTLNMANYKGGAHPAELIATDGAGLKEKKMWTVNVAPKGTIPTAEAEDTIEAVETTSGEAVIVPGPESENPIVEEPAPVVKQEGETLKSDGSPVEITMTTDPSDGFALATAEGLVSITPVGTGGNPLQPTPEEEAAVSGSTGSAVDTVIRPIYDGGLQFQQIRSIAAPEEYTWKVNMYDAQVLKQVDARTAEVYEKDEQEVLRPAFVIRAEMAHDAVGTAVPTALTVSNGNLVSLTVSYRAGNPASGGSPFVYPITAGTGWEGGFITTYVDIPDEPKEGEPPEGEEEGALEGPLVRIAHFGPPSFEANTSAIKLLGNPLIEPVERKFKFTYCMPKEIPGSGGIKEIPPLNFQREYPKTISDCSNPEFEGIWWMVSAHGYFHYVPHHWVWVTGFNEGWCDKWGPEQPVKMHCKMYRNEPGHGAMNAVHGPIEILGQYRFEHDRGHWETYTRKTCFTLGGRLFPKLIVLRDGKEPTTYERPLIWEKSSPAFTEPCEWR